MAIYENNTLKELPIHGSSRLGVYKVPATGLEPEKNKLTLGRREYELANHLGNVLAVVSDAKLPAARVLSHTDYYAFGSAMPGRSGGAGYRYGFGGHERDDEIKGAGNHLSFGDFGYDPRIGRRWNVDPKGGKFPGWSPYNFALNCPIYFTDPDGQSPEPPKPFTYRLHVRSFISAATVRDPLSREFSGDDRNASLDEDATARGRAEIDYDPVARLVSLPIKPYANDTHTSEWDWTNPFGSKDEARAGVYYRMNQFQRGKRTVVDLLYSTYNPLTPQWATPAVDVMARIVLHHNAKNQTLEVTYKVFADGYPSTEAFIEDAAGTRVFLGARKEEGHPATKLPGGPTELRFKGAITINLDENGNFKDISVQTKDGTQNMSIQDWNAQQETKFDNP
jgi:RHS repeat-associated protein